MFGWKNPTIHRKDTNYKKRQQYALHFVHGRTQRTYGCHVKISEVVFSRYLRLQMSVKYFLFFFWLTKSHLVIGSFGCFKKFGSLLRFMHIPHNIHKHIAQFELKLIHPQNNCIVILCMFAVARYIGTVLKVITIFTEQFYFHYFLLYFVLICAHLSLVLP